MLLLYIITTPERWIPPMMPPYWSQGSSFFIFTSWSWWRPSRRPSWTSTLCPLSWSCSRAHVQVLTVLVKACSKYSKLLLPLRFGRLGSVPRILQFRIKRERSSTKKQASISGCFTDIEQTQHFFSFCFRRWMFLKKEEQSVSFIIFTKICFCALLRDGVGCLHSS